MKYLLTFLLTVLCGTASGVTIWGATDRSPATATMRFPVDTGAASSPGYLDIADVNTYVTSQLDAELTCLAALATTGLFVRTGAGTCLTRAVTGTAQSITVTNGDGVSGAPTLAIASDYPGQASIVTVGTVTSGIWEGTQLGVEFGGLNLTTVDDDQIPLGSGLDAYTLTTLTDCNAADSAMTYDTATNAFGCNTIAGGGGSPGGSGSQLQYRVDASTFGGVGGTSVNTNVISFDISGSSATNAATATPLTMDHTTSGTATTGFGFTVPYRLEDGAGNLDVAASAVYSWTDATSTSEDTKIVWNGLKAGALTAGMTMDLGNSGGEVFTFNLGTTTTEYIGLGTTKIGQLASGVGAAWFTSAAKSSTNYAIRQSADVVLNSPTSSNPVEFRQGNTFRAGIDAFGRFGIGPSNNFDRQFQVDETGALTDSVGYAAKLTHNTSGTAAVGFGIGEERSLENASGTETVASRLRYVWTDATAASEDANFAIDLIDAGSLAERYRISSDGHHTYTGVTAAVGSCGTSPSINGNDAVGIVTLGTGGITSCVVTFAVAYTSAPVCTITPNDAVTAAQDPYITSATTTLTVTFLASVASGGFHYHCYQKG